MGVVLSRSRSRLCRPPSAPFATRNRSAHGYGSLGRMAANTAAAAPSAQMSSRAKVESRWRSSNHHKMMLSGRRPTPAGPALPKSSPPSQPLCELACLAVPLLLVGPFTDSLGGIVRAEKSCELDHDRLHGVLSCAGVTAGVFRRDPDGFAPQPVGNHANQVKDAVGAATMGVGDAAFRLQGAVVCQTAARACR